MAFSFAQELQRVGVPGPLAVEIQKQELSGAGNVNRLLWSGVPVALAKIMAAMFTARTVDADKLVAAGMPYPVARVIAREVDGFPSYTGSITVSGDAEVGATLTGVGPTWSGNPTPTIYNVWQILNPSNNEWETVQGATGLTFVARADAVGTYYRFGQIATNQLGSEYAVSQQIGPIVVPVGGL